MKKGRLAGVIIVILCGMGIYHIVQLPPALTDELRGTYAVDLPKGTVSTTYMSVDDNDFHVFDDHAGIYLYGTYEQLPDHQYLLKGRHIEEQTITLEDHKFTLKWDGSEIPMQKIGNTTMEVNYSKDKAKANDRMTKAQIETIRMSESYPVLAGTYGVLDQGGNFSEEKPYRLIVDAEEKVFRLYDGESKCIREWTYEENFVYGVLLSGEGDKQSVFRVNSGFVLSVDGEDLVFMKLEDENILPDNSDKKYDKA